MTPTYVRTSANYDLRVCLTLELGDAPAQLVDIRSSPFKKSDGQDKGTKRCL